MIIMIVVVLGKGILWYQYFTSRPSAPVIKISDNETTGSRTLLSLLSSLEGLKFDVLFFEDRAYKSLQDFTPDIGLPSVTGRPNPFAPL